MCQHDDIPDWAKIAAFRETFPYRARNEDSRILLSWPYFSEGMNALARRIARDDKPPVSQETLIWREAWARSYDESSPLTAKAYREGLRDSYFSQETIVTAGIKLALEGFGKDGVQDNG